MSLPRTIAEYVARLARTLGLTPLKAPGSTVRVMEIRDGIEWYEWTRPDGETEQECQCARCGASCFFQDCWSCGGEGEMEDTRDWSCGGLIEMYVRCDWCSGRRGWWRCCSGRDWCEANPRPGRDWVESTALSREEAYDG